MRNFSLATIDNDTGLEIFSPLSNNSSAIISLWLLSFSKFIIASEIHALKSLVLFPVLKEQK